MIHLTLTTTRLFNSREELKEYCEAMVFQKVYTDDFWPTLFFNGSASFATVEKANNTIVRTIGETFETE